MAQIHISVTQLTSRDLSASTPHKFLLSHTFLEVSSRDMRSRDTSSCDVSSRDMSSREVRIACPRPYAHSQTLSPTTRKHHYDGLTAGKILFAVYFVTLSGWAGVEPKGEGIHA